MTLAEAAQKWHYRALIFQDEYADGIPDELHDLLNMAKNDEDTDVDSLPDLVELLTVLHRLKPYRRYNSSTLEYGAFPMLFFGLDYTKIRK